MGGGSCARFGAGIAVLIRACIAGVIGGGISAPALAPYPEVPTPMPIPTPIPVAATIGFIPIPAMQPMEWP